jgi:hypothetical protein
MKPNLSLLGSFSLILSLIHLQALLAQTQQTMQPGEYYLPGTREAATGFQFNADHTFGFYFVYGALDRLGEGTWQQKGDILILNGPRKPETDFVLVKSKKNAGKRITIQVTDRNPMLLKNIYCEIQTPDGPQQGQSDSKGQITFEASPVQSISLIHGYFPDRYSEFAVTDPALNNFEFTIDPHIVVVEFRDTMLKITPDGLVGKHPMLNDEEVKYVRAE